MIFHNVCILMLILSMFLISDVEMSTLLEERVVTDAAGVSGSQLMFMLLKCV